MKHLGLKKKFRSFSNHFVVFRKSIRLFTKYKKWERHIYDFVSFCKNAVVFKTFFIYQNTNLWTEIPFSKNLYHIETTQLICNTNQLTGFSMIRIFTGRFFRTGITKQTKIKKKYLGKEIEIKIIMLKIFCKVVFNTILT